MKIKRSLSAVLLFFLALCVPSAFALGTYLEPKAFLEGHFSGSVPKSTKIWMKGEVKDGFMQIMNRRPPKLMKYWTDGSKTVWILNEIGKSLPITTGYVVRNGEISQVRILIYRETHGYEVRHETYTKQFEGATLVKMTKLDRKIDGISGATLSHRSLQRMAKLALYLDDHVRSKN